jgi:hypothetical protein
VPRDQGVRFLHVQPSHGRNSERLSLNIRHTMADIQR